MSRKFASAFPRYKCRAHFPIFFFPLCATTTLGVCAQGLSCDCVSCIPPEVKFLTKESVPSRLTFSRPSNSLGTIRGTRVSHPPPLPNGRRVSCSPRFWGAPFHLACFPPTLHFPPNSERTKRNGTPKYTASSYQNEISPPALVSFSCCA